ncbi:MAG: PilT/PilU family type 4a pilus ATPase [bacterium]
MTALHSVNEQTLEIFRRHRLLPSETVTSLLQRATAADQWMGGMAIRDGLISENELVGALVHDLHLPRIDLSQYHPDMQTISCFDIETCLQYMVLPISYHNNVFHYAAANPIDQTFQQELPEHFAKAITVSVAPLKELHDTINKWYDALGKGADDEEFSCIPTDIEPESEAAIKAAGTNEAQNSYVLTFNELLQHAIEKNASDIHLTVGSSPLIRIDGELQRLAFPKITQIDMQGFLDVILTKAQRAEFDITHELDLSYSLPSYARFRMNIFTQRGSLGAVLRVISSTIPTLDSLGMPNILRELTKRKRGLVLITGPSGAGKSTTVAALINEINMTRSVHVMTIEDPVEYLHRHKQSEINQREVGTDTGSFAEALRHVQRQDPDVIFIGEMRDIETITIALTAAEIGHLVFSTLHTNSAVKTIDRIIDVFPPYQQEQIRSLVANVLEGVVTQCLLPNIDGKGRSCAQEILLMTDAMRNMIRESKTHLLHNAIQSGTHQGMQTMDQALKMLVQQHKISMQDAELYAANPEDLQVLMKEK